MSPSLLILVDFGLVEKRLMIPSNVFCFGAGFVLYSMSSELSSISSWTLAFLELFVLS